MSMAEAQPPRVYMDVAEDINYTVSLASISGGVRPGLDVEAKKENIATEQSTEQNPLCVISNTVSLAEAEPPRVYMDIAEDINYTVSGGVRRGMDRCSDEDEGVDRRRKSHAGMAKNRQPVVPRDEPCAQTKCVVKLVKLDLRDMARKTEHASSGARLQYRPALFRYHSRLSRPLVVKNRLLRSQFHTTTMSHSSSLLAVQCL